MTVTAINEDETNPAGITIANLIASAGGDRITDADAGAVEGIAVTTVDNTNGTWQYVDGWRRKLERLWHPHRHSRPTLGRRQRQQPHTLCAQRQLQRQRRPGHHLSRMGPDNRRQRRHRQRLHQRRHHRLLDGYRDGRHHRKRRKRRTRAGQYRHDDGDRHQRGRDQPGRHHHRQPHRQRRRRSHHRR